MLVSEYIYILNIALQRKTPYFQFALFQNMMTNTLKIM